MSLPNTDLYLIPDMLQAGLRVVFCGTALGHESARQQAYYAHPQNKFWPTLAAVGLTPVQIAPKDYPSVLKCGIGLTDINKTQQGMDHVLDAAAADAAGLRAKMLHYQPGMLAFTSKRAASFYFGKPTGKLTYGLQAEVIGATRIWVLPSPSPAAQTSWDIGWWEKLAEQVK
jgi:TDG/mug DNA glycosylase family protein